jgi:hypothetical protein
MGQFCVIKLMKNFMNLNLLKMSALAFVAITAFSSCKEKEVVTPPVVVVPPTSNVVELSGKMKTQTLDATKKYLIKGIVTIGDSVIVTVPAGTVLMGQKSSKGTLLVKPGGKLIAEGTAAKPIVFTSNQAAGDREQGDWGGIVMLGKANVNQNNPAIEGISPAANYGSFNSSANDNDNSGILKYVRIEYAGIALTPNNETNALTMGAIGSATTIDYVQVTYGGDDGFEWFGGTVNCAHLVSVATWDDDFDADFGYSGKVQYAIAVRDPFNADQSGSNAFEVDNDASGSTATPKTAAVFSNITVLGPVFDSTKALSNNYQHAMHLRRNCEVSIFNSVFAGFPIGLNIDGSAALTNYTTGLGVLDKNILVSTGANKKNANPFVSGTTASTAVATYWSTTKSNTVFTRNAPTSGTIPFAKSLGDAGIPADLFMNYNTVAGVAGTYPVDPNFSTFFGLTQTGAAFTDAKLTSGFTATTFKGAFGSSDWTDMWSNFNPQNAAY